MIALERRKVAGLANGVARYKQSKAESLVLDNGRRHRPGGVASENAH